MDPLPFLVMPYLPLGNLEDLHNESSITVEETLALLFQGLNALQYLHLRGVAHRDLKPENILVESRYPLSIKLADFGLANDRSVLRTACGTRKYAAPELHLGDDELHPWNEYTVSVDLWSLGVIILQYAYGLPEALRQRRGQHKNLQSRVQEWGVTWCRRIVDYANDWKSDDLIDLLTTGMIRIAPEERLSARACLTKGCHVGLFDGQSVDSRSATPRSIALQGKSSDDDSSTTILLGTLWDTVEENLNYNGGSRTGHSLPNHTSEALDYRNRRENVC